MPYDIVDAYRDILTLNEKIDLLIQELVDKKVVEGNKDEKERKA